jgi:hypothetical protein
VVRIAPDLKRNPEQERRPIMATKQTKTTTTKTAATSTAKAAPLAEGEPGVVEVHKALLQWLRDRKATMVEKSAYHRVALNGKTVLYLHKPTAKSIRLEFPMGQGRYENIRVTSQAEAKASLKRLGA